MSCPSKTKLRVLAPALLAGATARPAAPTSTSTAARRSRPSSGDAVAANRVTQMVDPWPPASANRNIAFNGEKACRPRPSATARPGDPAGQRDHQLGGLSARRRSQRAVGAPTARRSSRAGRAPATAQPDAAIVAESRTVTAHEPPAHEQDPRGRCSPPTRRSSNRCARPSGASAQIELRVMSARWPSAGDQIDVDGATVVIDRSRRQPRRRDAGAGAADAADRRLAAGRGGHAGFRRRGRAQRCCRCGSRISW